MRTHELCHFTSPKRTLAHRGVCALDDFFLVPDQEVQGNKPTLSLDSVHHSLKKIKNMSRLIEWQHYIRVLVKV
jgi:hypothetical protein